MARRGFVARCRTGALALVMMAGAFHVGGAMAQRVGVLDRIEAGVWELRDRDGGAGRTRLCINSGRELVQLRHQRDQCRSYVIEETAAAVTIQYTCPGNGYGRTSIRVENGRLVQMETQGIAGGLPFLIAGEARRIGDCPR